MCRQRDGGVPRGPRGSAPPSSKVDCPSRLLTLTWSSHGDGTDAAGFSNHFRSEVRGTELDTDALQELVGSDATGEDPYIVVRHLPHLTGDVQEDAFLLEFHRHRIEDDLKLAVLQHVFKPFYVAFLDAGKGVFAVRKRDVITVLNGQPHGGFHRAIAAAHYEDLMVDVVVGFNQPVHDLRQVFALYAELSGRAPSSHGEEPRAATVLGRRRRHGEYTVGVAVDLLHRLAGLHPETFAFANGLPEGEQVLFRELGFLEGAGQRELHRAGHDQLLARILGDGAAYGIAFQREVTKFAFDGAEGGADAGGSGADNHHVEHVRVNGGVGLRGQTLGDSVDAIAALVDRILDQREAAEFAGDKEIGDVGLQLGRHKRQVRADPRGRVDHGDGVHRQASAHIP